MNLGLSHAKPEINRNGKCKYSKPLAVLDLISVLTLGSYSKVHGETFAVLLKWIPLIGNETLRYAWS